MGRPHNQRKIDLSVVTLVLVRVTVNTTRHVKGPGGRDLSSRFRRLRSDPLGTLNTARLRNSWVSLGEFLRGSQTMLTKEHSTGTKEELQACSRVKRVAKVIHIQNATQIWL